MGCDIHPYLEIRPKRTWLFVKETCDDRDYDLFGVLADVRNYVNAPPISKVRGFPCDASSKLRKLREDYGEDGHSDSWLTWKDISEYDWNQTSVDGRTSEINIKTGEELSKASYASIWEHPEELEKQGIRLENKQRVMKELITKQYQAVFDEMKELSEKYGSENVRLVFWFDN